MQRKFNHIKKIKLTQNEAYTYTDIKTIKQIRRPYGTCANNFVFSIHIDKNAERSDPIIWHINYQRKTRILLMVYIGLHI